MMSFPAQLARRRPGAPFVMLTSALGIGALTILMPGIARAEFELGADISYVGALEEDEVVHGAGGALRIGQRYSAPLIVLSLELEGGLDSYGGDNESRVYRGTAGAQLGLGTVLRPSVFVHAGVAHVDHTPPSSSTLNDETGLTADGGLALDFTLIPLVDIGVHAAYGTLPAAELDWMRFGAQATLVF